MSRLVYRQPGRGTRKKCRDWLGPNGRAECHQTTRTHDRSHTDEAVSGIHVALLLCGEKEGVDVLETIAIILIILWLLGMVSGYTLGNFIWVLLVVAVVLFLVRLVSGRRVV